MDKYIINGKNRLLGEIKIDGAKNAVLPILAATIMNGSESIIHNVPHLRDIDTLFGILGSLGCVCKLEKDNVTINSKDITNVNVPEKYVREMRSSIVLMGAVLARCGQVRISFPGGCEIGPRPIDLHLMGLKRLGAKINESHGYILCECDKLIGTEIHLDYPSVGATENIMLAAVNAKGVTIIQNAAREPEIIDLQDFLNKMGSRISGSGSSTIKIEGIERLNAVEHTIIPDRIAAGTIMAAVAATSGDVILNDIQINHIKPIVAKFLESGCIIKKYENKLHFITNKRIKAVDTIKTLPYPGFPTDMQAQMMAAMTIAKGTSVFIETVFESRYKHADELIKMGANIKIEGRTAIVRGVKTLTGAEVNARDLRAGAALTIAGLSAEGTTIIDDIDIHVDRGYDKLEEKLRSLGADIQRIKE